MEDVSHFFQEVEESFTVYVVDRSFASGRGREYFESFRGKENYIASNTNIQKRIYRILNFVEQKVPQVADLVEKCFLRSGSLSITEVITSLVKLFSVHEHQAAGPEVVDPIIIQEGQIFQKFLSQLIALHYKSILRPRIIIILKDDRFERAKKLLEGCPNGMNVKMIRNNGETEIFKIINKGTRTPDEFIEAYARQCFSTCSQTPRNIILNDQWAENSLIKAYSPEMFRIRTKLINDEKSDIERDLDNLIHMLEILSEPGENQDVLSCFRCMAYLSRIFCHDRPGRDLSIAKNIAEGLNNELLKAHVFRFSHFFAGTRKEKQEYLDQAFKIFSQHNIADHAIYCLNNKLVHQFSMDEIRIRDFRHMEETALSSVPGLVGMSHILISVGVAHLLTGNSDEAIDCFTRGLEYAKDRPMQKMVLLSNRLMARSYSLERIDENEIIRIMNQLFDSLGRSSLPFNVSHFAMNILSVAFKQDETFGEGLMHSFPVKELVQRGFDTNIMGSGSIIAQIETMAKKYPHFTMLDELTLPLERTPITGIRFDYIQRHAFNPFFHNVWL